MTTATTPLICADNFVVRRDLSRKLSWLVRLREDAESGVKPLRSELQQLAQEFPGALREVDETPLDDLRARLAALEEGTGADDLPPWAQASWLYHHALRTLLTAAQDGKRPLGGLVELALRHVASSLNKSEAEVTLLVLPSARRRKR